jgi:hypothetical protein
MGRRGYGQKARMENGGSRMASLRCTRGDGENTNQIREPAMRGILICRLVWVAAGLALQPAHGGDRKQAAARPAETFTRGVVFAARARSSVSADVPQTMRSGVTSRRGEFSFSPVSPLEARARSQVQPKNEEKGPTSPHERRNVTFFRLDPKFGDVSVQPVVGGVNGAQLSVGY